MVDHDLIKFGIGITVIGALGFIQGISNFVLSFIRISSDTLHFICIVWVLVGLTTIAFGLISKGKNR